MLCYKLNFSLSVNIKNSDTKLIITNQETGGLEWINNLKDHGFIVRTNDKTLLMLLHCGYQAMAGSLVKYSNSIMLISINIEFVDLY